MVAVAGVMQPPPRLCWELHGCHLNWARP